MPLSQTFSVKQEGRVCRWFSFSDVGLCWKRNDAESISHCLCYARTLIFQGRVCAVFCKHLSRRREEKKKCIYFDIYKLIDTTVKLLKSKLKPLFHCPFNYIRMFCGYFFPLITLSNFCLWALVKLDATVKSYPIHKTVSFPHLFLHSLHCTLSTSLFIQI